MGIRSFKLCLVSGLGLLLLLMQAVKLLAGNGIMSVNYFGSVDENLHLVGRTLQSVLGHVRCFGDEHKDASERNFVFFAARQPIRFRCWAVTPWQNWPAFSCGGR